MQPTQEQIDELKAKHGAHKLKMLDLSEVEKDLSVIIRRPSPAEYGEFRKKSLDEESRDICIENLSRQCVVFPSKQEFSALMEEYPALGETIGSHLVKMAGGAARTEAKKL